MIGISYYDNVFTENTILDGRYVSPVQKSRPLILGICLPIEPNARSNNATSVYNITGS